MQPEWLQYENNNVRHERDRAVDEGASQMSVYAPPVADFMWMPDPAYAGETIWFFSTSEVQPGDAITYTL